MTETVFSTKGNHVTLSVKGHADYNPGNDIVCAAVSTVTYGFANYLDSAEAQGKIKALDVREKPGEVTVSFDLADFPEWPEIHEMMMTYYRMLSYSYPDNVRCI